MAPEENGAGEKSLSIPREAFLKAKKRGQSCQFCVSLIYLFIFVYNDYLKQLELCMNLLGVNPRVVATNRTRKDLGQFFLPRQTRAACAGLCRGPLLGSPPRLGWSDGQSSLSRLSIGASGSFAAPEQSNNGNTFYIISQKDCDFFHHQFNTFGLQIQLFLQQL